MLKRLIEVALPLKEVSEHSAREKSIRHGHISTLHIWWARRPLAACRAAVFASLIPDPDDPKCPEEFRKLVMDVLGKRQFQPTNGDGSSIEDTPRNRCLEFIKHLVRWENSNNPDYIEPARKLIAATHKLLYPDAEGDTPKVLDPFAGGGSIPLEALRLGCEAHAIDLNPVAHLIELCTLVYPQKFGQSDSRPVPDYIKRLIAHNQAKKKARGDAELFDKNDTVTSANDEIIPDVEITEVEYRQNPLAADLKYWGYWIQKAAEQELRVLYPSDNEGKEPAAYLWARTVMCPNPTCRAMIPLVRSLWLCKKANSKIALRMLHDKERRVCEFRVVEGKDIDFDPESVTIQRGQAECPFCQSVVGGEELRRASQSGHMGQQLLAVMSVTRTEQGKHYRIATQQDDEAFKLACASLDELKRSAEKEIIPDEPISPDRPSPNSRGLSGVVRYGLDHFASLFNSRQLVALAAFVRHVRRVGNTLANGDADYGKAVVLFLSLNLDRLADLANTLCRFEPVAQCPRQLFARQAAAMVWDYAEGVPISGRTCSWENCLERILHGLTSLWPLQEQALVQHGSATSLPAESDHFAAIVTDPPYYDSVPYSDLSDFFYVWLKRTVGRYYPHLFRTPLTPKGQELIAYFGSGERKIQKLPAWYESGMQDAFKEMHRVVKAGGIISVMFAHKTTTAWEALIGGLLRSGFSVTASWPLNTEMTSRMVAQNAAALASSVTLVCRKRAKNAGNGFWDDVRQELKEVANERLDFFWIQGIRGADFFISAIGPALSVFGKYERVTKLSGEEVTVGQFLDEVRSLVTNYTLAKILHTTHTAAIDSESRFYIVWKWSYGDENVPADESFKLSQALGMHTEEMWDRTGVLEKSGENVQAVPIVKRMRVKNLGEPTPDGAPASLIDVLHRMCAFRETGDTQGMAQFLGQSGHANNPTLWLVAQAISEILPDGDKEK